MIFRALEAAGKICYSGDMFDNWTYFGPVEMMEKDRYSKVCLCIIFVLLTPKNYLHINFLSNQIRMLIFNLSKMPSNINDSYGIIKPLYRFCILYTCTCVRMYMWLGSLLYIAIVESNHKSEPISLPECIFHHN